MSHKRSIMRKTREYDKYGLLYGKYKKKGFLFHQVLNKTEILFLTVVCRFSSASTSILGSIPFKIKACAPHHVQVNFLVKSTFF